MSLYITQSRFRFRALFLALSYIGLLMSGNVQAQVLANGSMIGTAADMPNGNTPNSWTGIASVDTGDDTVDVDCAVGVLSGSTDSGSFARGVTGEGLSQTVTGLTSGATYFVQFEQSRILHFGRATGHWEVTMFGSSLSAPVITAIPGSDPGQTAWEQVVVGPFVATGTSTTLSLAVQTDGSGTDPFAGANISGTCAYPRETATADLTIDGVRVFEDLDSDGDGSIVDDILGKITGQ